MEQNKWELKSHSWQIADTGDYDGYWEITDGKTSICTKDDPADERLEDIIKVLNNSECKFYANNATENEQQLEIYKLKDSLVELQAKCEKYEAALENILNTNHDNYEKVILKVKSIANEALSAGGGEKIEQERTCKVCGKRFMAIADVVCSEECYFNLPNQKEDKQ